MNSAEHLLSEDRPEFERVLDEALRDEHVRAALAATTELDTDHLRSLAINATAAISTCAATEYAHLVRVRLEARDSGADRQRQGRSPVEGPGVSGRLNAVAGSSLVAAAAVLIPLLAGASAVILLVTGHLLQLADPDPAVAAPLRFAGWLFAAVGVVGLLVGMTAVMFAALRNPAADAATIRADRSPEVAAAREEWRRALLERGVRPFLAELLTSGELDRPARGEPAPVHHGFVSGARRTPSLGYSAPGFTSPNPDEPEASRTAPDYLSPRYTSPRYSGPDFDTGTDAPDRGND